MASGRQPNIIVGVIPTKVTSTVLVDSMHSYYVNTLSLHCNECMIVMHDLGIIAIGGLKEKFQPNIGNG